MATRDEKSNGNTENTGGIDSTINRKPDERVKNTEKSVINNDDSNEEKCPLCNLETESESKMIECESCEQWACRKCHCLSETDIKTLKSPGIHWVCKICDNGINMKVVNISYNENKINNLEQENNAVLKDNENLRFKLNETKLKLQKSNTENESLKAQIIPLTTKRKETINATNTGETEIEAQTRKSTEKLTEERKNKDKEIKSLQNKIKKCTEEAKKYIENIEKIKTENEVNKKELTTLKELNETLEIELAKARSNTHKIDKEIVNIYDQENGLYNR